MSAELNSAVRREAPTTNGTDPSDVRRYTTDAVDSISTAVPVEWQGRYVALFNESVTATQNIRYLFSLNPAAVVNIVAADSNGAANTALGAFLPVSMTQPIRVKVPKAQHGSSVFFVRRPEAGTPSITVELCE